MSKPSKKAIFDAINVAAQEVTGQRPRQAKKRRLETHASESGSFFAGSGPAGPKQLSNAQIAAHSSFAAKSPERTNFRGQIVTCADGSLRNISECWQDLFKRNEEMMFDDAKLYERMLELFPGREESKNLAMVQRIRSQYNSGRLPGMTSPPEIRSRRFRRVNGHVYEISARGLMIKEIVK